MSSEEEEEQEQEKEQEKEQVTLEEKGRMTLEEEDQEQNGQYWLKMITGSCVESKEVDNNNSKITNKNVEDAQAWSAGEEEDATDKPARNKVSRNKKLLENENDREASATNFPAPEMLTGLFRSN